MRTVLITGASSGFGAAAARRFAALGDRVIAAARRTGRLTDLAKELGPDVLLPLTLDVRDRAHVERLPAELPADFAQVDILVNNAGLALGLEPAQAADVDQWEQMIETNCTGLVYMTRAFLPQMVARGRGHVVNLGSIAGTYPYPGGNVYGATKAFVHQFSLNLRSDLHGTGIRVTCVEPGLVGGTEFSEVRFGGDRERAAAVYTGTQPLTADDIAAAIEWATSQPAHVNVNVIELMPVSQSFAPFQIHRGALRSTREVSFNASPGSPAARRGARTCASRIAPVAPRMFAEENAPPESLDRGALIGARLRQRRIELGMTARELARRVDCSPSLISQVERGRAVPSVSTLWALVTALRISMDRLFDPAQEGPAGSADAAAAAADSAADSVTGPVLRRYARPRITLERGVVWERLTAAAEKDMEFLEVCYPVGQSVPEAEHAIQHTGQEFAVIVEGALSTQIGFEQYVLEEGDSLTFDSAIPHRFWNAGTVPARAIWVILNRSR